MAGTIIFLFHVKTYGKEMKTEYEVTPALPQSLFGICVTCEIREGERHKLMNRW